MNHEITKWTSWTLLHTWVHLGMVNVHIIVTQRTLNFRLTRAFNFSWVFAIVSTQQLLYIVSCHPHLTHTIDVLNLLAFEIFLFEWIKAYKAHNPSRHFRRRIDVETSSSTLTFLFGVEKALKNRLSTSTWDKIYSLIGFFDVKFGISLSVNESNLINKVQNGTLIFPEAAQITDRQPWPYDSFLKHVHVCIPPTE